MGILTIAFPVTIVGTALTDIWKDYIEKRNKNVEVDFAAAEQKLEAEILSLLEQVAEKQANLATLRADRAQEHKADEEELPDTSTRKKRSKT